MIIDVHTHPPQYKNVVPDEDVVWNHVWRPDRPVRATICWQGYLDAQGPADQSIVFAVAWHPGMAVPQVSGGEGWAVETFTRFGTHDSTHIDVPWHYNSHVQGQRAQTIDELPLEWFFGDGVVLDMTARAEGDPMSAADAQAELVRIGYIFKPLDIVLVRTGRDAHYGRPDYMFRGCGVTAEATRWLYDQGVRVMGIDAWGWDAPLDRQAREALARRQPGIFWAAHQVDLPYAQIERLVNLDTLPPFGFKISCFPLKIVGGSAGPARIVALLDD